MEVQGCSRRIQNVVTLMAPGSVVFDSITGAGVPGAIVTLVNATGRQCGTTPVNVPGNPATTDPKGGYSFPPVTPGNYCLAVQAPNGYHFPSHVSWTHLPPGRNLNVTGLASGGSYGNPFPVAVGGLVVVDVPVDSVAQSGLFVQKTASRASADLGEFIDYTIQVHNGTGNALAAADVVLADDLPLGFGYVPGTARGDGKPLADPPAKGPHLVFTLGHLARDQQVTVTYRVRLGPGSMQGDGTNRAQSSYSANGATTVSNVASVRVQVTGGVFSDQGFILGKVFLDCNANGMQDRGELGVAGVRVLIEDGTYVITDGQGQLQLLRPRQPHPRREGRPHHAARGRQARADQRAQPGRRRQPHRRPQGGRDGARRLRPRRLRRGARLGSEGARESGGARRRARHPRGHAARDDAHRHHRSQGPAGERCRSPRPAPTACRAPAVTVAPAASSAPGAPFTPAAPVLSAIRPSPAPKLPIAPAAPAQEPLEKLVPDMDRTLAFVGLADGDTLPQAQTTVRVKGCRGQHVPPHRERHGSGRASASASARPSPRSRCRRGNTSASSSRPATTCSSWRRSTSSATRAAP